MKYEHDVTHTETRHWIAEAHPPTTTHTESPNQGLYEIVLLYQSTTHTEKNFARRAQGRFVIDGHLIHARQRNRKEEKENSRSSPRVQNGAISWHEP